MKETINPEAGEKEEKMVFNKKVHKHDLFVLNAYPFFNKEEKNNYIGEILFDEVEKEVFYGLHRVSTNVVGRSENIDCYFSEEEIRKIRIVGNLVDSPDYVTNRLSEPQKSKSDFFD